MLQGSALGSDGVDRMAAGHGALSHLKRMLFAAQVTLLPDLTEGVTGGLPPFRPRPSASRFRITPTHALYMRVKSVSIFRTMHCTADSLSPACSACSTSLSVIWRGTASSRQPFCVWCCGPQLHDRAQQTQHYWGLSYDYEARCPSSEIVQHGLLLRASGAHFCRTPEPYVKLECSREHSHRDYHTPQINPALTLSKPGA